jgi:hypothetical protein
MAPSSAPRTTPSGSTTERPGPAPGPALTAFLAGEYNQSVASGSNSAVECDLAKVEVAGSNPVSRSNFFLPSFRARYPSGKGEVCKTFIREFDSPPRLQPTSSQSLDYAFRPLRLLPKLGNTWEQNALQVFDCASVRRWHPAAIRMGKHELAQVSGFRDQETEIGNSKIHT